MAEHERQKKMDNPPSFHRKTYKERNRKYYIREPPGVLVYGPDGQAYSTYST